MNTAPTFGDVIRTHLALRGESVDDFLREFVNSAEYDSLRGYQQRNSLTLMLGGGWRKFPKQIGLFLSRKFGNSFAYWYKVNRLSRDAYDSDVIPVFERIVDLNGVKAWFRNKSSVPETEIDTPVSSGTVIGFFLVAGACMPGYRLTVGGEEYKFNLMPAIDGRRIWMIMRQWAEQQDSYEPTLLGPAFCRRFQQFYTSPKAVYTEICQWTAKISRDKEITRIRPFASCIETEPGLVIEWNKDFTDIMHSKIEDVRNVDSEYVVPWRKYLK